MPLSCPPFFSLFFFRVRTFLFISIIPLFLGGCLEVDVTQKDMSFSLDFAQNPISSIDQEPSFSRDTPDTAPYQLSDSFVPSMSSSPIDWSPSTDGQSFGVCVSNMKQTLLEMKIQNCSMYSMQDQQNPSSGYHRNLVVAACLYLACDQRIIEGHNGVMISKSCSELDDLYSVLERAQEQAQNGECLSPTYQTAWVSLDQFQGGENCDQIQCSLGPDIQVGF